MAKRMRNHCATCGKPYERPTTWAYCSKACQNGRRGRDATRTGDADEWLTPLHDERLRLHRRLEDSPRYQHAEIHAQLLNCEQREAAMREAIAAKSTDTASLAFWICSVRRECDSWELTMRRSIAAAIRLGQKLIEAKQALPYGDFGKLFRDHDDAVPGALPMSRHQGHKFMSIAANGVTGLGAHAQQLPADTEALYVLSRIPPADLEAAIHAGSVSARTTRAEARTLLTGEVEAGEPQPPADPIDELLDPIRVRLAAFASDHPDLLADAAARLKGILRGIQRAVVGGAA